MQDFASFVNVNNKIVMNFWHLNLLTFAVLYLNSSAADGSDSSDQQWCGHDTLVNTQIYTMI